MLSYVFAETLADYGVANQYAWANGWIAVQRYQRSVTIWQDKQGGLHLVKYCGKYV